MGNRIVIFHGCTGSGQPREVPETRDPRSGLHWRDGDLHVWTNSDGSHSNLLYDHGKQTEFLATPIDRAEDVYVFVPHDGTAFDEPRHVFIASGGRSVDSFKRAMCPAAASSEPPAVAPGPVSIPGLDFTVQGLALPMAAGDTKKTFTPRELTLTAPDGTTVRYQGGTIMVLRQEKRFAVTFKGFQRVSDDPAVAAFPQQLPALTVVTSLDARGPEVTRLSVSDDLGLSPIINYLADEAKLPPASIRHLIDLAQQHGKEINQVLMTACIGHIRSSVVGPEQWKRWFGDARDSTALRVHILRYSAVYPTLEDLLNNAASQSSSNPHLLAEALQTFVREAPALDAVAARQERFGDYLDYLHKTRPRLDAAKLIAIAEQYGKNPVHVLQTACFKVIQENAIAKYGELAKTALFNSLADYAALQATFKTTIANPTVIELLVMKRLEALQPAEAEPSTPKLNLTPYNFFLNQRDIDFYVERFGSNPKFYALLNTASVKAVLAQLTNTDWSDSNAKTDALARIEKLASLPDTRSFSQTFTASLQSGSLSAAAKRKIAEALRLALRKATPNLSVTFSWSAAGPAEPTREPSVGSEPALKGPSGTGAPTDKPQPTGLAGVITTSNLTSADRFVTALTAGKAFQHAGHEAVVFFAKTSGSRAQLIRAMVHESARALKATPGKMRYVAIVVQQGIAGDAAKRALLSDIQDAGLDAGRVSAGRIDVINYYVNARPIRGRFDGKLKDAVAVMLIPRPAWQRVADSSFAYEAAINALGSTFEEGHQVGPK